MTPQYNRSAAFHSSPWCRRVATEHGGRFTITIAAKNTNGVESRKGQPSTVTVQTCGDLRVKPAPPG